MALFPSSSSNSRLRLTILTQFYPPDFAATGQFVEELARNLAQQEMLVQVFTGMPGYAYAQASALQQECCAGVDVRRSRVTRWGNRHLLGRMLRGLLFCVRAALHLCISHNRGDLLLFVSEPPYLQTLGYIIHLFFRIPYACLVYDLYPDVAVELGLFAEKNWIVKLWNRVNRAVWSRANIIIVPSDTMQERIVQQAPHLASKIIVIHNWADSDWIRPLRKQDNDFARTHDLADVFTVLYSGNMGRCHDIDTILDAALELQHESVQFVFIGGGPKREKCYQKVQALNLKNCKFLPYQDRSVLPQSLTACDLSLVSVAKGMEGLVAPSKFYSALASGRPVAVICEPHSYLRQMVADGRCGAAFSNGDGSGLASFVRHLLRNPVVKERMGEAGHHYVAQNFSPRQICVQYKWVLQQTVLNNIDLEKAIENREFRLHYQAIFSLKTEQIRGFEALLRWQKEPNRLLSPRDFLPRLEATGWILSLTGWILAEAASQLKSWQKLDAPPQYIRINLSSRQFYDPQLIQHIQHYWLGSGLSGSSLGFDLTETVLMKDPAGAVAILLQLRELGVQIYLDSFGSGVVSLQSLHQFALDGLALDRTLIGALSYQYGDRTLVESLISLSEHLQLSLHAEGISTAAQLKTLKSLGIQQGQGQWLAPALEPANASRLLANNRKRLLNSPLPGTLKNDELDAIVPTLFTAKNASPKFICSTDPAAVLSTQNSQSRTSRIGFNSSLKQSTKDRPVALVADDEAIMRKVFRRFLEQDGFCVMEASGGEGAVAIYKKAQPSVVLLDAVMPGMNGFDCCRIIHQLRRELSSDLEETGTKQSYLCLVTSLDDSDSIQRAFDTGADDYMIKPINWAILQQRLHRHSLQACR